MKKQKQITEVEPKPVVLKRITPKLRQASQDLYDVQSRMARVQRRLDALKEQEAELLALIEPVFAGSKKSARFSVPVLTDLSVEIRYVYVDRLVTDGDKVERILTRLGKVVPKRHNIYSFIKAVAVKPDAVAE